MRARMQFCVILSDRTLERRMQFLMSIEHAEIKVLSKAMHSVKFAKKFYKIYKIL